MSALLEALRALRRLVSALPRKVIDLSLICSAGALLGILWISDWLGDIYSAIYQTWPGRQWTLVFRDYKVLYVVGMGVILVGAWILVGKRRKVTGLWSLLVGLAGYLAGHVLWGVG